MRVCPPKDIFRQKRQKSTKFVCRLADICGFHPKSVADCEYPPSPFPSGGGGGEGRGAIQGMIIALFRVPYGRINELYSGLVRGIFNLVVHAFGS